MLRIACLHYQYVSSSIKVTGTHFKINCLFNIFYVQQNAKMTIKIFYKDIWSLKKGLKNSSNCLDSRTKIGRRALNLQVGAMASPATPDTSCPRKVAPRGVKASASCLTGDHWVRNNLPDWLTEVKQSSELTQRSSWRGFHWCWTLDFGLQYCRMWMSQHRTLTHC